MCLCITPIVLALLVSSLRSPASALPLKHQHQLTGRDLSSTYDEYKTKSESYFTSHPDVEYTVIAICIVIPLALIFFFLRRRKRRRLQREKEAKAAKNDKHDKDEAEDKEKEIQHPESVLARVLAKMTGMTGSDKPDRK